MIKLDIFIMDKPLKLYLMVLNYIQVQMIPVKLYYLILNTYNKRQCDKHNTVNNIDGGRMDLQLYRYV